MLLLFPPRKRLKTHNRVDYYSLLNVSWAKKSNRLKNRKLMCARYITHIYCTKLINPLSRERNPCRSGGINAGEGWGEGSPVFLQSDVHTLHALTMWVMIRLRSGVIVYEKEVDDASIIMVC